MLITNYERKMANLVGEIVQFSAHPDFRSEGVVADKLIRVGTTPQEPGCPYHSEKNGSFWYCRPTPE